MGLRSWLRDRITHMMGGGSSRRGRPQTSETPAVEMLAHGCPASEWEELPAYLPVDPHEHKEACIIAAAIAAGDMTESNLVVRRICIANPEHRRVACIATALGAGALETSSFTVKRIFKKKDMETEHAA